MNKKLILISILTIISSFFIYGCEIAPENITPSTVDLENSIKKIIQSKGEGYDFLSDELFISKINELGIEHNFTLGNLNDDSIPEPNFSDEYVEIIELYSKLSDENKAAIMQIMRSLN